MKSVQSFTDLVLALRFEAFLENEKVKRMPKKQCFSCRFHEISMIFGPDALWTLPTLPLFVALFRSSRAKRHHVRSLDFLSNLCVWMKVLDNLGSLGN